MRRIVRPVCRAALVLLAVTCWLTWDHPARAAFIPETDSPPASRQTSVILFIGDGMGFEHVKAGGYYLNGEAGSLVFESFPYQAQMSTHSANNHTTDSAAAATAIATGFKVNNGVISLDSDGTDLVTLLETARDRGQSTGLVTTSYLTDATPAGFGAHAADRLLFDEIAGDLITQTRPHVLLGGGGEGVSTSAAAAADYQIVTDRSELQAVDTETVTRLAGLFGEGWMLPEICETDGLPNLSEMTTVALQVLDNNPEGFFLMVEGGLIDVAAHANHIGGVVTEVAEFDRAVQVALDWAEMRSNLMIVVLADHETGGLTVIENNGLGELPTVTWATTNHTSTYVPVYAWGMNAERVSGLLDNTHIPTIVASDVIVDPPDPPDPPVEPTPPPADPNFTLFIPHVITR